MKLLAIDTSTEQASVALMNGKAITRLEQPAQRHHAQFILPMVDQLLVDAGLSLSQCDGIVFGRGPGSFTGLRIACSVAKGLAYAQDLPVYPVSTLAAIAAELLIQPNQKAAVLAMIDARMNQVYWACYTHIDDVTEERVSAIADIVIEHNSPLILAGVNYEIYRAELPAHLEARVVAEHRIFPDTVSMLNLVVNGKIAPVTAADALPVCIRNQITQGESRG